MTTTVTNALTTTATLSSYVALGTALYAIFGPRRDTAKAATYTVGAVLVGAGAGVASSLLQGSALQVASGSSTTGTGALPPLRAGTPT